MAALIRINAFISFELHFPIAMATDIRHLSEQGRSGLKDELLGDGHENYDPTSDEDSSFNSTRRSGIGSHGDGGTCTSIADRLCVLWNRHRADIPWLLLYGCISVAAVVFRLLAYPKDPAASYWPGIAKGSAEAVLINTALTILAVCHRLFHRLRRFADRASVECLVSIQSPIEKHVAFHKITGCVVLVASLVHSVAWLCIILKIRHCKETNWRASRYHHLSFLRDQAWQGLLARLPIWTGVAMLLCAIVAAVSCLPCVRKRWYNVFAMLHVLFLPFTLMLLVRALGFCWSFGQPAYRFSCAVVPRSRLLAQSAASSVLDPASFTLVRERATPMSSFGVFEIPNHGIPNSSRYYRATPLDPSRARSCRQTRDVRFSQRSSHLSTRVASFQPYVGIGRRIPTRPHPLCWRLDKSLSNAPQAASRSTRA